MPALASMRSPTRLRSLLRISPPKSPSSARRYVQPARTSIDLLQKHLPRRSMALAKAAQTLNAVDAEDAEVRGIRIRWRLQSGARGYASCVSHLRPRYLEEDASAMDY